MRKLLTLEPMTKEEVPTKRRPQNNLLTTIEAFFELDSEAARVTWVDKYKTPASCANALNKALRQTKQAHSAKAIQRDGRVFLIKL